LETVMCHRCNMLKQQCNASSHGRMFWQWLFWHLYCPQSIQWDIKSERNFVHVANLTKLETCFRSSTDHKFQKFQYFHFIFGWHPLWNSSASMHAQSVSLHKTATPTPVPAKSLLLCDCPSSHITDDHLRWQRNATVSVIRYPLLHL
jgi:hypothetical protein